LSSENANSATDVSGLPDPKKIIVTKFLRNITSFLSLIYNICNIKVKIQNFELYKKYFLIFCWKSLKIIYYSTLNLFIFKGFHNLNKIGEKSFLCFLWKSLEDGTFIDLAIRWKWQP